MELKGRLVVVTGGARGIGKSISMALAEEGADVAIGDIDLQGAQRVAEEICRKGGRSIAFKIDISNHEEVVQGFKKIREELGSIDILVNNAAITTNVATLNKMDKKAWDQEVSINLSGAFYCTQQVFDSMAEKRWGRIVNISSLAGVLGGYGQCGYSSCKAGIIGLTKTIALEGGRCGITANCVAPGIIETEAFYAIPEKMRERIVKKTIMGAPGKPEDVAHAVTFFASEKSKYITGQVLIVGGGIDLFSF